MAGDGVSRDVNLQGPLDALRQSLQGIRDEAQRPMEIPVRITGAGQARQELEGITGPGAIGDGRGTATPMAPPPGILPHDQDWLLRPSANRHKGGGWDGPEDFAGASSDRLGALASEGWDKILGGGAYHTMQESGRFGRKWGSFLDQGKAGEQRAWADAAATPEGRSYMESMEDTEKLGKKIAGLLREIAQGGHGAVKAAEDLKKAQNALEEVGNAGKKAADGLGGEMGGRLKGELEAAQASATSGKGKPDDEGFNPRSILGMIHNPKGALMQGLEEGILSKLTGLGPNALGAAGMGAAVVGGVYLGAKFNMDRANDATKDSMDAGEDVRLSRSLGRNFDFRGSFWDENRSHAKEGVNSIEGRRILRSMGIGLDNFKGDAVGLTGEVLSTAMDNGLEATDLGGALGSAVNTGQVKRDQGSMEGYLQKMAGHLQVMAGQGVTSNAALAAIATLNSQQVQALGRLTEGSGGFNANLLDALGKTGDPALRGQQGAALMSQFGHVSGNQVPMVLGRAMKDKAAWAKSIGRFKGEDEAKSFLDQDPMSQIFEASQDPALVTFWQAKTMQSEEFKDTPNFALPGLLGIPNRMAQVRSFRSKISDDQIEDLLKKEGLGTSSHFQRDGARSLSTEGRGALTAGELGSRTQDERLTEASISAAERMKGAAGDLDDAVRKFSRALDNAQMSQGLDNALSADPTGTSQAVRAFMRWAARK